MSVADKERIDRPFASNTRPLPHAQTGCARRSESFRERKDENCDKPQPQLLLATPP